MVAALNCFLFSFFTCCLLFTTVSPASVIARRKLFPRRPCRIHIPLSLRATADLPLFGRIHM
ncbi:hypothetical protein BDV19DRAFT_359522 [Aspergillus venezuelensis]